MRRDELQEWTLPSTANEIGAAPRDRHREPEPTLAGRGSARHTILRHTAVAVLVGASLAGCTTVNTSTVKAERSAGITRTYSRPPGDLYQAAVLSLEGLRSTPDWRDLEITERDPAQGTVIAERDLNSAVIPGLGERDAIGIFVEETSDGDSAVTVVRMSSDQFPGSAGTTVNTARDASGLLFPAIDDALAGIPEQPRPARVAALTPAISPRQPVVAPAAAPSSAPGASPASAAPANAPIVPGPSAARTVPPPAPAPAATPIDHLYDVLRASGAWRPLVREVREDGDEEVRVGKWAVLTASGNRVLLRVKSKDGSPVDAARLALELERAGFTVDVESATAGR